MDRIGPTAYRAVSLEDFIEEFGALDPDAVSVAIDIFRNPQDIPVVREFGDNVFLPLLVRLLHHYAVEGNETAGHALSEIANSQIPTWGKYAGEARDLANELVQQLPADREGY
ncbi:MAG: hypothetical protein ACRDH6_03865 [Actinomycetota bacterium]